MMDEVTDHCPKKKTIQWSLTKQQRPCDKEHCRRGMNVVQVIWESPFRMIPNGDCFFPHILP